MKQDILILAALALFSACGKERETQQQMEALRVSVEQVQRSTETRTTPYVGVVEEEQSTMVSFTGMAVLKSVNVAEGQAVRKGQLLATLDDAQARNALAAAKSALDQARDAEQRMRKLYDNQSLPDMKWVEVQSKVEQAQASYDMCLKNLQDCSATAPCSGVVGSKIIGVGETVLPSEPVLSILSIDRVKVRVSIPEKEIAAITPSTASTVTLDALPGAIFQGTRIEKGVTADAVTHTYNIRILLDNPEHKLLPGMVAHVSLAQPMNNEKGDITVPVRAIQQTASKELFVWTAADGKAIRRPIQTGDVTGNRIVVCQGLQEGEQVIVEGYQKVSEGTPIIVSPAAR